MNEGGGQVVPEPGATGRLPPFSSRTRLLVVAPHPDDETIATGVLVQQVRAAGGEVRILLLTEGDNNPWPQRWLERRVVINASDRRRWGRRRHGEMLQALRCLEVPPDALQSMGWPDLGLVGRVLHARDATVSALRAAIEQFGPSLLVAPALADRHPDHAAAHVLVRLALASMANPPPLLVYLVHARAGSGGGAAIDIAATAAQAARKDEALVAHHSQMALSARRLRRLASGAETHAAVAPTQASLPWQPSVWLRPWLRLSLVGPAGTLRWRWNDAPLRRDGAGRYQLAVPAAVAGRPSFVRLALDLQSPWIFDHWGWCELTASSFEAGAESGQRD